MSRLKTSVLALSLVLSACSSGEIPLQIGEHPASFAEFTALPENQRFEAEGCQGSYCQQLRQEFAYIVYFGSKAYCYWDEKRAETGTDFSQLKERLMSRITDRISPTEYQLVLREWAAAFHDGHVNAILPKDMTEIELYSASSVRLEVLAPGSDHEKLIIASVKGRVPFSPGQEVVSVNGVPALDAITQAEKLTSGSTSRMRRSGAARRLVDVLGAEKGAKPLVLEVLDREGRVLKGTVPRVAQLALPPMTGPETEATGFESFEARVLSNEVGYLRIDGFMGTQDELLLSQAMDRLSGTRALLIDVRLNGGGDQSGNRVLERLIDAPVVRYFQSPRISDFLMFQRPDVYPVQGDEGLPFAPWSPRMVRPASREARYSAPVFVLTSPRCFSACDTFTSALKVNGLATVLGEGTGGGTGSPLVFDLPYSGGQFRYSVVRGLTAKNGVIEGAGTLPDVVIEPTQDERRTGVDDQLDRAIAVVEGRLASEASSLAAGELVSRLGDSWQQDHERAPLLQDDMALRRLKDRD